MIAFSIVGGVLLVLMLMGLIPITLDAAFIGGHFSLEARVWFLQLRKKKNEAPSEQNDSDAAKGEKPEKKRALPTVPVLKIILQNGYNTLSRLVTRLKVDTLMIHFVAGGDDPADTAMAYAAAGVALEALLCAGEGRISHADLRADLDFNGARTTLEFRIKTKLRVYQHILPALDFGYHFLKDYLGLKKGRKNKNG